MRIIGLEEFLQLPTNTVFSFYDTEVNEFGTLCLKKDVGPRKRRDGGLNFWYVELTGSMSVANDIGDLLSALDDSTKEFRMDLDTEVDNDLMDDTYRFVVYDTKDILQLADRLQQAAFGN